MKPITPNTMIQNRYLVVHQIGKGGMGEVYLAVDQRLGSAVAIKRMTLIGDDVMAAAFEREAKVLGRLRHPVLPKVIDHFVDSNGQFLVMEHISGDDLAKRLESADKPFPLSWVMFWADQLLDGLNYLHSHEPPIIHRDIKPQNLKLTDENNIVLLDFGLSKDFDTGKGDSPVNSASVSGYSPAFAPMEQIRGSGTDARSDLYSFAASFYQLLANVIPTDALARADSLLAGSGDPVVPLHVANSNIPESVSAVFMKALSLRQDDRYSTAAEMQRALRRAFNASGQQTGSETLVMASPGAEPAAERPSTSTRGGEVAETPTLVMGGGTASVETDPGPKTEDRSADLGATIVMGDEDREGYVPQSDIQTQVMAAVPENEPETSDVGPEEPSMAVPTASPALEDIGAVKASANDDPERPLAAAAAATTAASVSAAVPGPAPGTTPKKGGGSKVVFMVVAGIIGLLFIGGVLAGGAFLYMRNQAVLPEPQPQSSPSPVEAANTPTQASTEPTAEPEQNNASEPEAANTDPSDTKTVSEDRKPAPDRSSAASTPKTSPQQRDPASREPKPATPKPTPKPKSGDDRTVIMQ